MPTTDSPATPIVVARGDGIGPEIMDATLRTGVLLKAPITTPQGGGVKTLCVDHHRCRFLATAGLPFIKTEGLYTFDGADGFSRGQGQ